MATASTHFKIGLFVVLGLCAVLATAFVLGVRGVKSDTVAYHTLFDESVQGLEIGAPVKYRGVLVGNVSGIQIAPDRKLVDVTLAVNRADATRLALAEKKPELRAQLGTQGITGVKLVDIDFFDPKISPAPQLSFPTPENYIPARPSLLNAVLANLEIVGQRLPDLVDVTIEALRKAELILDDLHGSRVPELLARAINTVNDSAAQLGLLVRHVDRAQLPEKTAAAIDNLNSAANRVNGVLASIDGDGGLVQSTQRATDSIGDLGRNTAESTADLEHTLRDLDEAALAIRQLAESIDRDPDMLVKGRARAKNP